MTIVVLADIHANYAALEAAVHRITVLSPDAIILLGDYITDCPDPRRTLNLLYALKKQYAVYMVRGNREEYLLNHRKALAENRDDGWSSGSGTGALLYTYHALTSEDLDFLASLPVSLDISLPGCPLITACHGSPFKAKDWLIGNDEKIRTAMKYASGDLILCGHAHRMMRYDRNGKSLLICPSLGLPQDRNNTGNMSVLRWNGRRWLRDPSQICTRVNYDMAGFIREFEASDLYAEAPIWSKCVIRALTDGEDYPAKCATLAYQLARKDGIRAVPPERYWIESARALGIE